MSDCCGDHETNKTKDPSAGGGSSLPIILIGFLTLAVLVFGIWFVSKTGPTSLPSSENASVFAAEMLFDWEDIDIGGGNATHEFYIENKGTDVLELANVRTSCACTTAQIVIDGVSSPYFGMHSTSSWVGKVQPGGSATVKVAFDPAFHGPDALGPVERLIAIETNDSENPALEFRLTGNVIQK